MQTTFPTIVGLVGVTVILIWYFLLQIGKCKSDDLSFSIANALGSIFLLYSLFYEWNSPTVVIEVVWLMISLYGILKFFSRKKAEGLTKCN